jgi:RNA polymerase sigma-70 factor (ECF subfamily)
MNAATCDEHDRQDMERLAAGHDAALNDLMGRHAERLFHYVIRCLRKEDDAEDVAQESFIRVYQHRGRFDPKQRFSTWLYAIATNLVKDRFRYRARHPQVSLEAENETTGGELGGNLPAQNPLPSESVQAGERAELVRQAVAALPEELRTPLILAEYEEKSQAEIAAILDCSVKAVEMRIYRARQQLRARLGTVLEVA